MTDIWDTSEAFEPLRVCNVCVEDLRGGNAGDGCEGLVSVREGRAGGALRPETASGISGTGCAVVERRGSAGADGRVGIAGMFGDKIVPSRLMLGVRASGMGRTGGGGGGGRFLGPSP